MASISTMSSNEASIGFFDADHEVFQREKPYVCLVPLTHAPADFKQTNIEMVRHTIPVKNVRGFENQFKLDVQGFQLVNHSLMFDDWHNGRKVVAEHYPRVVDFLKRQLGADKVVIYDHSLRLGDHVEEATRNREVQGRPAVLAHVDNSMSSTILQIREDFKKDAEELLSKRFQIVNFWHPIMEPVLQQPLAFCDYRTARDDAFPADLVYPHLVNENMLVRYSPGQQWYFLDEQKMQEGWLIKICDSSEDPAVSKFCPHTSFTVDWRADEDVPLRQSVEFRAYVFYG